MREPPSNALGHREPSGMRRGLRCFQRADGGGTESRKAGVANERPHVARMFLVRSWCVSGRILACFWCEAGVFLVRGWRNEVVTWPPFGKGHGGAAQGRVGSTSPWGMHGFYRRAAAHLRTSSRADRHRSKDGTGLICKSRQHIIRIRRRISRIRLRIRML